MNTALISLDLVARINRVDIDIRSFEREFGVEDVISPEELIRIARRFDFKAKIKQVPIVKLVENYPLPAIAIKSDNDYAVVLKSKPGRRESFII